MEESPNLVQILQAQSSTHNYEKIYQQNKRLFDEYDSLIFRQKGVYCISVFKMKDALACKNILMEEYLRISDKYIKVDERYHIVIFTFSTIDESYQAILRLERTFSKIFHLDISNLFTCSIVRRIKPNPALKPEKEEKITPLSNKTIQKIKEAFHLVEMSPDRGQNIILSSAKI